MCRDIRRSVAALCLLPAFVARAFAVDVSTGDVRASVAGFLTGAHTEADVDRVVEATAAFLVAHRAELAEPAGATTG